MIDVERNWKFGIFILLLSSRIIAALLSNIQDCDEVFNYWEPLHYYQYSFGFQTWEYVRKYSLRSWTYILFHHLLSLPAELFSTSVSIIFPQVIESILSTISEFALVYSIKKNINATVGNYTFIFLLFSPGMFISSTAFLPSSFGMYALTIAYALNMYPVTKFRIFFCIFFVTLGGVWGWPFCLGIALLYIVQYAVQNMLVKHIKWMIFSGIISVLLLVVPLLLIDSIFYSNWTLPPLNLILYNVFGDENRGPDLYGTEPWWFYITNGILNFNIVFLIALATIPVMGLYYLISNQFKYKVLFWNTLPFYYYLFIFSLQPHKEERFMSIMFPLVCFNAAVTLHLVTLIIEQMFLNTKQLRGYSFQFSNLIRVVFITSFIIISSLRVFAIYKFYHSSITIFTHLEYLNPTNTTMNVCIGKEWYRFPSHYHLPNNLQLKFIKSNFNGLLPTYFNEGSHHISLMIGNNTTSNEWINKLKNHQNGYSTAPSRVNDLNQPEPDRYVNIDQCQFLIDSSPPNPDINVEDQLEPFYGLQQAWKEVKCLPFLDTVKTKFPARSFYLGNEKHWMKYCIYQSQHE
ncbi:Alg9-like mannosyltransferase family-domain-containing protein [Globomyces pollinis-pini]|nr:Alg9-like mannosyltransferase family-domain-containing protein [Globomyces pollinis-pini]